MLWNFNIKDKDFIKHSCLCNVIVLVFNLNINNINFELYYGIKFIHMSSYIVFKISCCISLTLSFYSIAIARYPSLRRKFYCFWSEIFNFLPIKTSKTGVHPSNKRDAGDRVLTWFNSNFNHIQF